jgi:Cu/Ag efflux protein CusF
MNLAKQLKLLLLVVLVASGLTACRQTGPEKPAAATLEKYDGTGVVEKIERDKKSVTLNHEPIKGYMEDAMTMPFHVRDAALLDAVKEGDKVAFALEIKDNVVVLTKLEKTGVAATPTPMPEPKATPAVEKKPAPMPHTSKTKPQTAARPNPQPPAKPKTEGGGHVHQH